jgi:hypothetical protein
MKEQVMRPADVGGEKLELDALCGAELTDEDLDGVTGGVLVNGVQQDSVVKEDRAASQLLGMQ